MVTVVTPNMDNRQQWRQIKRQAPVVAALLTASQQAFGKPAALWLELASGEVIEVGAFAPVRLVWNGQLRRAVNGQR